MKVWDAIIVGGGPAGLSAALVLGRAMRSVLVIDEEKPRNFASRASHGFLTRDGVAPEQLHELGQHDLKKYETVAFMKSIAVDAVIIRNGIVIHTLDGREHAGRYLIIAAGVKDHLPSIPGLKELYGTSAFPCPYCDGWEHRDLPAAILGQTSSLFAYIQEIYHWNKLLSVFTNGPSPLTSGERSELSKRSIALYEQPVARLEAHNGELRSISLSDGTVIAGGVIYLPDTGGQYASDIPERLGVKRRSDGRYKSGPHGSTDLAELYIIGDANHRFSGLAGAAAEGYEAGIAISGRLLREDWDFCR